ncbi:hypothetical protein PPYR_07008 [Photinus pyralis]|uniref:alpha-glucosidase n=2 Tax=Photinus pyralis TaxID=7054 RepID=A0A5N4APJ1_PHOPY|nr:uncharacterized protein LOC116168607 [Photinus pyralis]KAB0799128.1 hypothetical protein PPYR_07008 [Photinus pyralis]
MLRIDLLLVLTIGVAIRAAPYVIEAPTEGDQNWWKNALFYQVYPRSFKDSDGDGIGDLEGIRSKLHHLKDAGVTGVWFSPIYQSPQKDLGYDISNYTAIDGRYGTMQDFENLLKDAHAMGIRVIMDFVPNHSSDQHEWFQKSIKKEIPYRDYYVWKDGVNGKPPNNWISVFKGSAWTFNEERGQYYLHQFSAEQPDLNYNNPQLVAEMKKVLKFWMDKGVDGFRFDAVPYIWEDLEFKDEPVANAALSPNDFDYLDHIYTKDRPETFDVIYEWRQYIDDYMSTYGGDARVIMTEAYSDIESTMKYYGNGDKKGAQITFNFQLISKVRKESTAKDIVLTIKEWFAYMPPQYTPNWVIGNHDNHRVATRFGPELVDAMNMLVALLPGVMVTYNGEEIGQEDGEVTFAQGQDPTACGSQEDFKTLSRDFERTPFQWSDSKNGGFSDGDTTWLPVSIKYKQTNLAAQNVSGVLSHYNIYKQLVKLRQEPEFLTGSFKIIALSDKVLAFTRSSEQASYLVLINISGDEEELDLTPFTELTKYVTVVVKSSNSDKKYSSLSTEKLPLKPYEAIVAKSPPDVNSDWWKHALFYQIYPRSFKDDNNDGIGDLKGITGKLEHLKNAGVTAAWLSPIFQSPQVDQGYDISDYTKIDEPYGTMDDFDALVQKAHDLGLKIILDFVPNHSSNKHEWFIESEKRTPGYENFYVWRDGKDGSTTIPPNNWLSIFSKSAWTYSTVRKQFYLHQFAEQQPDLNYRDSNVVEKMKDVMKFWLDKGVDGFRIDAIPYLFEDDRFLDEPLSNAPGVPSDNHKYLNHPYTSDQPETFDMVQQWRQLVDTYTQEHGGDARVIMTEAYTDINNTMRYYGEGDKNGAHFTFNFQFVSYLKKESTANDILNIINEWLDKMPAKYTSNWVLGNHDNTRIATKYGPERVDGMNMLIAGLPGVMVTYNGEEIGQENGEVSWEQGQDPSACIANKEDFQSISRDFERTPFQWDDTVNAGFNKGKAPWLPVSNKYKETNLKAQSIPGVKSHFHVYQELVELRRESAFTDGAFKRAALSENVLAYTRGLENGPVYLVVINIANVSERVDISRFEGVKTNVKVLISNIQSNKYGRVLQSKDINLSPYEAFVAKVLPDVQKGDMDWWKHAVFYQIYPRSFKDSNNDGIGDLKGIISKLDHLKDAGITATWLSPIYKSPQVDQGYDISDFMDLDENYGTLDDFRELVQKAHSMGIKIIMDFVPNHSSNKHEWFIKSENNVPGFEDFYVWREGKSPTSPPNNWLSSFKYSAWEYSAKRKQYYLHQFAKEQPDLNYSNPVVVQNMKNVLKFWLDRDVDGFRMDAVPTLFEDEAFRDEPPSNATGVSSVEWASLDHIYTINMPKTYDMIYQWRDLMDDYVEEYGGDARVMMTEVYTTTSKTMEYYGNGQRLGAHFSFNFHFITKIDKQSNASVIVSVIDDWIDNMLPDTIANWVIGNHDNHRAATRFGPDKVDGMNALIAVLPGVMVTYNGEEIGQEDGEVTWEQGKDPGACNAQKGDFSKFSRDFERTPFQWDDSVNAGFNEGATPWLPVGSKYKETNLKAQSNNSEVSHYQIYKRLLQLRNQEVVRSGTLKVKPVGNLIVLTRTYLSNVLVFIFNVGDRTETGDLSSEFKGLTDYLEVNLASSHSDQVNGALLNTKKLTLKANDFVIAKPTSRKPDTSSPGSGNTIFSRMAIFMGVLHLLLMFKRN